MKLFFSKLLLNRYKLSYKRPGLIHFIIRGCIPLVIKANFIMLEKGEFIWGFGHINKQKKLSNAKIVHFVSIKNDHPNGKKLGSARDVSFKEEIFQEEYDNRYFKFKCPAGDDLVAVSLRFKRLRHQFQKLPPGTKVYIDIPGSFLKTIKFLKRTYPNLVIVYRAHNPEPYHNLDKFLSTHDFKWLIKAARSYCEDLLMLKYVDYVDSISKSDVNLYWAKICSRKYLQKLRYVPFALSEKIRQEKIFSFTKASSSQKSGLIMGSIGKSNPLNLYSAKKFLENRDALKQKLRLSKIKATGDFDDKFSKKFKELKIQLLGNVDNVQSVLQKMNYLIDIGGHGHGFKTKYLDAINSGCKIVIDHKFIKRIPLELLPFIITREKDGSMHEYCKIPNSELDEYKNIVLKQLYTKAKLILIN